MSTSLNHYTTNMKPTKQLIRGLRETAAKLRSGNAQYCWDAPTRCNCGILAQTLLDLDERGLDVLRHNGGCGLSAIWSSAFRDGYCATTGLPKHALFKALSDCGVEPSDYPRIEFLQGGGQYKNPIAVAAWMDAEADKLEQRRANGEKP